jgi:hypothetical protein
MNLFQNFGKIKKKIMAKPFVCTMVHNIVKHQLFLLSSYLYLVTKILARSSYLEDLGQKLQCEKGVIAAECECENHKDGLDECVWEEGWMDGWETVADIRIGWC